MNRYLEFCLRPLDAFWSWRFDEGAQQTLRPCQDHRSGNGVDRGQGEDRSVIIVDGCLVLIMVIDETVRRHVAMDHEFGMSVVFTLVDMLGRSYRQQADSQAEHARDNPWHPHT